MQTLKTTMMATNLVHTMTSIESVNGGSIYIDTKEVENHQSSKAIELGN